ncbi:hypothetical protein GW17_00017208 [Ensete ventricosum]|nr:hypothetical protein GW17_00017208 [Ensete ventricosum]
MPRPRFDASRIAAGSDVVVSVSYGVKCGGSPRINSLSFDSWQILHNSIQPGKLLDLATHVATLSHGDDSAQKEAKGRRRRGQRRSQKCGNLRIESSRFTPDIPSLSDPIRRAYFFFFSAAHRVL